VYNTGLLDTRHGRIYEPRGKEMLPLRQVKPSDSQVLLDGWLHLAGTVQTLQVNPPDSQTAWQPGSTLLLLLDVCLECLNPPSSCAALSDMYAEFRGNACTSQADPGNDSVMHGSKLIEVIYIK
jgi:hypothetical protein